MNLLLHIGVTKSGSTAIQKSLGENGGLLERIYVPKRNELPLVSGGHHRGLGYLSGSKRFWEREGLSMVEHLLKGEEGGIVQAMNERDVEGFCEIFISKLEKVIEKSEKRNYHTILLSSELLSEIFRNEDVKNVCEMLNSLFDQVKVIVYLREQVSAYVSLYSQNLKGGVSFGFPEFVEVSGAKNVYNYHELIHKWSVLGWEVTPRIYPERRHAPVGWNILDDFEEALLGKSEGLLSKNVAPRPEQFNVSSCPNSLCVIRFFNQHGLYGRFVRIQQIVLRVVNSFFGGDKWFYRFNKEALESIRNKYLIENELIAKRFFNRRNLFEKTDLER